MLNISTFDVGIGCCLDVEPYEVPDMVNLPHFPGYGKVHLDDVYEEIPKKKLHIKPPEPKSLSGDGIPKYTTSFEVPIYYPDSWKTATGAYKYEAMTAPALTNTPTTAVYNNTTPPPYITKTPYKAKIVSLEEKVLHTFEELWVNVNEGPNKVMVWYDFDEKGNMVFKKYQFKEIDAEGYYIFHE